MWRLTLINFLYSEKTAILAQKGAQYDNMHFATALLVFVESAIYRLFSIYYLNGAFRDFQVH